MQNTGFLPASYVFANGQVTGTGYSDPNNILIQDGDVATSLATADISAGGFLTNLPSNAVITGIEFKLRASRGQQTIPAIALTFSLYDNTNGANAFYPYTAPFTGLTTSLADHTFGTPTYLFASAFSVDQINNLKLNIAANGNTNIDYVSVNVYYFLQTIVPPPVITVGCVDCNSIIQLPEMNLEIPFNIGQTKFYLQAGSFSYADGTPVVPGDLGSCNGQITWVFDEGKRKGNGQNFMENATLDSTTGSWQVLPSGVIEVDLGAVTQRGLQFHTPYLHDATLMSDHDANSKVIISNNGPYDGTLLKKCHIGVLVSAPIRTLQEGISKVYPTTKFNFKGSVSVVQNGLDAEQADITITNGGGTLPPAIVNNSSATGGNVQVPTLTWMHTSSSVNRLLLVEVSMEFGKTVTSITYNGVALTLTTSVQTGTARTETWQLIAPPVGTFAILITFSAASYCSAGAQTIAGVDQAVPTGTIQTATGNNFTPTLALVTTFDNSIVIDALSTALTPILYTPGPAQIENWHHTANTDTRQGGSSAEQAGLSPDNIVMDYAITQSTPWAYTAVEVKGITTASATGQVGIQFEDETGAPLGAPGTVDEFEITGGGVLGTRLGNKVTYTLPAPLASSLFIDQTPDNGTYGLLGGAVNGTNTTFTVSTGVYLTGKLLVWRNGILQQQGVTDDWQETVPASGTFDFIVAPLTGDVITAQYI